MVENMASIIVQSIIDTESNITREEKWGNGTVCDFPIVVKRSLYNVSRRMSRNRIYTPVAFVI